MNPWIIYIRERFSILTYMALIAGISLSGLVLDNRAWSLWTFLVSFIGIFMFFAVERLMSDSKDLAKDLVAYPDKPLPRGVIAKPAVTKALNVLQMCLFAYALFVWVAAQEVAALAYVLIALYAKCFYHDFYCGDWLRRHLFIQSLLKQAFIFPVVFFAVAINHQDAIFLPSGWLLAVLLWGAFFCYDLCQKLDPKAHPIIASYVHLYGFQRTFELAALALAISLMAATALNLLLFLLPCQLLVLFSLALLLFQPKWFKIPEIVAGLSLMLHAWAVVLHVAVG